MGLLRNGKAYSPCGKGPDKEKRRLSLSSEKEHPNAKRRDIGQSQPMVLMRSLSGSNLHNMNREPSVDIDATMQVFMKKMEGLVNTTLAQMKTENADVMREVKAESAKIKTVADSTLKDIKVEGEKYMAALKLENTKLSQGVSSLQKSVDDQAKSLTTMKKDLRSVEKDLTACFDDTKTTIQAQGERISALEERSPMDPQSFNEIDDRISKLERIASEISTKLDNMSADGEADLYPVKKSIVAMQVWINAEETPLSVAKLIIGDVLNLPEVGVVCAEVVDEYEDGKCTIKILLDSAASVKRVLEAKIQLRTCDDKDIRAIWIRRSKTTEQRMLEKNCALLLREVDKVGKYRQNDQGRIVRVYSNNNPTVNTMGSQESLNEPAFNNDDYAPLGPMRGRGNARGRASGRGSRFAG